MENLKLLVVFVVFIIISQIGLSQTTKRTYLVDTKGNVTKIEEEQKQVSLFFEDGMPELTDEQVSQLVKNGKIQVSEKHIKGYYEQFILFYVPRVEVDSCFLSEDGSVSYKSFPAKDEPRVFSWWFLLGILGIGSMVFFQTKKINIVPTTIMSAIMPVLVLVIVFAPLVASTIFAPFVISAFALFALFVALVFVMYIMTALSVARYNKKITNVLVYMYYLCTIVACIFFYLQW